MYVGIEPQFSLSGLGAAKAKAKAAARHATTTARQQVRAQLQDATVAGRRVKLHPKDAASGAQHLNAVISALQATHTSLKHAVSQVRTPAQARQLLPVLASHRNLLSQNMTPSMISTASRPAARAAKASRLRGLGALAWNVAGLLGLGDEIMDAIADSGQGGIDPNDPNNQGGGGYYPAPYTPPQYGPAPYQPPYQPPYPNTPTGVDPTTGQPYSSTGGSSFNMLSMLPLLMSSGSGGSGSGCTNPNLPRCIIANMAAQSQQNLIFIFMLIMQMFQETTQNMNVLQSQAYGSQYGAYGYGQTPYSPYGYGSGYGYGSPQYGATPYGSYGGQYGLPGFSADSSQIPPGYDTGSAGGDMFTGGSQDVSPITSAPVPSGVPQANVSASGMLTPSPQQDQMIISSDGSGGSDPNALVRPGSSQQVAAGQINDSGDSWNDGGGSDFM